ncbi:MAG: hypothetical protein AAGE59_04580 [Cyanobacteria bacterium P01_F01_bin.86]
MWGMVQWAKGRSRPSSPPPPDSPDLPSANPNAAPASLPYIKAVNVSSEPAIDAVSSSESESVVTPSVLVSHPLRQLGRLHWRDLLFYLGFVPGFFYGLVWLPHIHQDPRHSLLGYQKQLYTWHTAISGQAHRYCAPWYTWPWLGRSRPYYIEQIDGVTEPGNASSIAYHYVSGMGNPFLWWQSAIAIILLTGVAVWTLPKIFARETSQAQSHTFNALSWTAGGTALYILLSYLANWLPWAAISRCSIIYHYMPASLFSFLALAWVLDRGLDSKEAWKQAIAGLSICLIVFGFWFWLPFFLGLPVTPEGLEARVWFKSWSW